MLKSVLFELQLRILALRYLILSKEILFLFDEACLLYFIVFVLNSEVDEMV